MSARLFHNRYNLLHDALGTPRSSRCTLEDWMEPEAFIGEREKIIATLEARFVDEAPTRAKIAEQYQLMRQLRRDCGWDDEFAMVEAVWNNMDPEGRDSAIEQYTAGAAEFKAAAAGLASRGLAWGAF